MSPENALRSDSRMARAEAPPRTATVLAVAETPGVQISDPTKSIFNECHSSYRPRRVGPTRATASDPGAAGDRRSEPARL